MLVDKQSELMSDLLFTVHQQGGDDVTWKPPIATSLELYEIIVRSELNFHMDHNSYYTILRFNTYHNLLSNSSPLDKLIKARFEFPIITVLLATNITEL